MNSDQIVKLKRQNAVRHIKEVQGTIKLLKEVEDHLEGVLDKVLKQTDIPKSPELINKKIK